MKIKTIILLTLTLLPILSIAEEKVLFPIWPTVEIKHALGYEFDKIAFELRAVVIEEKISGFLFRGLKKMYPKIKSDGKAGSLMINTPPAYLVPIIDDKGNEVRFQLDEVVESGGDKIFRFAQELGIGGDELVFSVHLKKLESSEYMIKLSFHEPSGLIRSVDIKLGNHLSGYYKGLKNECSIDKLLPTFSAVAKKSEMGLRRVEELKIEKLEVLCVGGKQKIKVPLN